VGQMVGGWFSCTPRERRTLIAAGAGAGLAAAFNAPLAGLVFVLEEVQRDFSPGVFTATLIASAVADVTTRVLLGQLPVFAVQMPSIPPLSLLPVALLLGVADVLRRSPPTIGVDLLFVDGEDYGDFTATPTDVLIGSRHYAANQVPGPAPLYAVLFDLVADRELQIYQEGNSLVGAPEVVSLVWEAARKVGHAGSFIETPRHTLIDDHLELQKVGIRAIDVVDFDYPAWHTPDDTIDKVSAASLQIVGDVAMALVRREQ